MSTPRVLVTAVGAGSVGEQVSRALLQAGDVELVVANLTVSHTAVIDVAHARLALPRASSADYPSILIDAATTHGCSIVIPGSEPELRRLAAEGFCGDTQGVSVVSNRPSIVLALSDKTLADRHLAAAGLPSPRSWVLKNQSVLDAICLDGHPPWIVKPAHGGGSRMTAIAQDDDELRFFAGYLEAAGEEGVVQEYLGRADEEYTVGVVHGPRGELLSIAVMRRDLVSALSVRIDVPNRTGRPELGERLVVSSGVSQGWFVESPELERQSIAIAERLGSVGPLNIQGRVVDGTLVPFEINPRFSGTSGARAMANCNEPRAMVGALTGVPLSIQRPRPGYIGRGLVDRFSPTDK